MKTRVAPFLPCSPPRRAAVNKAPDTCAGGDRSGRPRRPPRDRNYLLERVDDAAVVQLYADGFATLPLDEKTLI